MTKSAQLLLPERGRSWRSRGVRLVATAALIIGAGVARASPPTAPGSPLAISVSSTQTSVTWTASSDNTSITAYFVQRCAGLGCSNFVQVASVTSGTSYLDAGLLPAATYSYRIEAEDSADTFSPFSSTATTTTLAASASGSVSYAYDARGRLVQATVPSLGTVENYTYDSSGNLTSIVSSPITALEIGNLSTTQGAVGGQITIDGSGFSTTPSSNIVEFNGIAGTVVSATSTQLVVTVPAGATTGLITVQTGSTTVTSPTLFTVDPASAAPAITMFSPTNAAAGSEVTIFGTGFQPVVADNQVQINQTWATVVAATSTNLTVIVPQSTATGLITVSTPNGSTTSASALTVLSAQYILNGFMSINSPTTITAAVSGQAQLELFNGTEGAQLAIAISNFSFAELQLTVIGPDNSTLLIPTYVRANGQGIQLPKLPKSGTYTIIVNNFGYTGAVTLSLLGPITQTLNLGAPATPVSLANPGEWISLNFTGTENAYVSLILSSSTLTAATVYVYNPDGSLLESASLGTNGVTLQPQLPQSGLYSVVVQPTGAITGGFNAAVATTTAPTLTINQSPHSLTLTNTTPVTLPFDGAAGQYLSLAESYSSGANVNVSIKILNPDGSQLASANWSACPTCAANVTSIGPLIETGTYSVVIQETSAATVTTLLTLASPVIGTANVGTPTSAAVSLVGQGAIETFNGVAGQYISVAASPGTASSGPMINSGTISLLSPNGAVLVTQTFATSYGGIANVGPLRASGSYTALIQQTSSSAGAGTGSLGIAVQQAASATLSVGSTTNVSVSSGQSILAALPGTVGQYLSIAVESSGNGTTVTAGSVSLFDPGGNLLVTAPYTGTCPGSVCSSSGIINAGPLASTGTYTLWFQQGNGVLGPGSGSVTITPQLPATGSLTVGAPSTINMTAGQGFAETFTGTAGQYLSLALGALSGSADSGTVYVISPTGTVLSSAPYKDVAGNGTGNLSIGPLPTSGQYTLLFQLTDGTFPSSGSITVTPKLPAQGALTVGSPSPVSLTTGQGIQESFSGSTGQYATLSLSESSGGIGSASVLVLAPNGTTLSSGNFTATCNPNCTGTLTLNFGALPSTGSYTVLVQQSNQSGSFGAGTLTLEVADTTPVAATTWNVSTSTAGQAQTFTFDAVANQNLALSLSSLAFSPSTVTYANVSVVTPSGSGLPGAMMCFSSGSGCTVSLPALPQDGTYKITVTPGGQATMTGTLTLSTDVVGTLTSGTPLNISLTSLGQSALLNFVAVSGQPLAVAFGAVTPTCQVQVFSPSGALIANVNTASAFNLENPVNGTYSILISPYTPITLSMQVTLASIVPNTLTVNSSANFSTTVPGQDGYFSFIGTAGEVISVALAGLTATPHSSSSMNLTLFQPNGTAENEGGGTCTLSSASCEITPLVLTQSGTYTMQFAPGTGETVNFTATVSQDVMATLATGIPLHLNLSQIGQNAILTFPITSPAGGRVALNFSGITTTPANQSYSGVLYSLALEGINVVGSESVVNGTDNLPYLPPSTYNLVITPVTPVTGTMQVTLEPSAMAALSIGGGGTALSTPAPGQIAYMTFYGTAGQSVSLSLTNMSLAPSSVTNLQIAVARPDGSGLSSITCSTSTPGCEMSLMKLSQTGTYTITASPGGAATMSFTAALTADQTGSLISGTPFNVSLATGQSALLNFTATAGQSITLTVSGVTTVPTNTYELIDVFNPTGSQITNTGTTSTTSVPLNNLAAGTYSVLITPQYPAAGTMQASYH